MNMELTMIKQILKTNCRNEDVVATHLFCSILYMSINIYMLIIPID